MNGTLLDARTVGPRGRLLRVAVDPTTAAAYTDCGQYCALDLNGETGFFAIARAPGPGPLEFFVQEGGGVSTHLLAAAPGARIQVSMPAGAGFGLAARPRPGPLYVVATGSGYGAVRGVMQAYRAAHLLVGFRSRADILFLDELEALAAAGTPVHLAISQGRRPLPAPLQRSQGYVQDALAQLAPDLSEATLVACGQPEMQAACQQVAGGLGLPPDRFLTNY